MGIVAKYKYDGSVYADLIPEFNAEFTDYTVTDEVDSENSNHIIRTIESDSLPTLMRFGIEGDNHADNSRQDSLLEILEMDTSALTTCKRMFGYCKNLTNIECVWDTSNVDNMLDMFAHCQSLTKLDLSSFDTSDVVNMQGVFYNCQSLTKLDLSSFDTSNVVTMYAMFYNCQSLTKLDLSSFDISNVVTMYSMISECYNLTSLDVSNFNTSNVTDMAYMLKNAFLLTDIGMIYCDQSTVNKVASLLPTDHNVTIWVESDDIFQYKQYSHITYKTQKVQDTVHLNSPLLKGDTIEVIDGKTYHVHRYEKVVYDGSESWAVDGSTSTLIRFRTNLANVSYSVIQGYNMDNSRSDKFVNYNNYSINIDEERFYPYQTSLFIFIKSSKLSTPDVNGFKQWLQANPTTVMYELATPYYELISEEPLELTLLDTTDNTINNNSILPSNMTIANKELSTIAIKPSTTYTLSFDKSNVDSEVTIDICGGEQITTVLNRIELTTPSELGSGIRFISSDGCIISNVRLLEGSLVKEAIPKETFEGLKSSFEDGYIIGENLANEKEDYFCDESGNWGNVNILFKQNLKANTTYTLVRKISNIKYGVLNGVTFYDFAYYIDGTFKQDHNCWYSKNGWYISKYTPTKDVTKFEIIVGNDNSSGTIKPRITISDYMIFEGDHTHLSEAELMRYIEKGTSHYEEEDYNHAGKYKVEYKVTGKNKFSGVVSPKYKEDIILFNKDSDGTLTAVNKSNDYREWNYNSCQYYVKLRKGIYTVTLETVIASTSEYAQVVSWAAYSPQETAVFIFGINDVSTVGIYTISFTLSEDSEIGILGKFFDGAYRIQIEEGTVATEYEPYKEDIKTYYLSSPLLEGDTIEDVNGVATHVKRYEKVVLDGSEDWRQGNFNNTNTMSFDTDNNFINVYKGNGYCDRFINNTLYKDTHDFEYFANISNNRFTININKTKLSTQDVNGFMQYLQQNPVTVVYQLASPVYETISTESILCDSYVNGHLDFDTNIPIEKVISSIYLNELKYLQPSTNYMVQFESDNSGILYDIGIGGSYLLNQNVVKGINKFKITSLDSSIHNTLRFNGIGFNISNIQVVATDKDIDFDYFKGLQSSFEDGLITDENDENYGKYKVECKIVGKNKFDVNNFSPSALGIKDDYGLDINDNTSRYDQNYISVKPNTSYYIKLKGLQRIYFYDINKNWISRTKLLSSTNVASISESIFATPNNCYYIQLQYYVSSLDLTSAQLEEGTQATSYEPYKESIHTLYLNSPLLKDDKLVVHDGKLCHYHKMGMEVFDGSEDWFLTPLPATGLENYIGFKSPIENGKPTTVNTNYVIDTHGFSNLELNTINNNGNTTSEAITVHSDGNIYIRILKSKLSIQNANGFKQWLQSNPTTVVYELETPYYKPIEPQLSQYSFSTVKEGDMEIITVLPIEKVNLTYRTDINGVSSIEEQIASIQEGTDISSIIDEEVDE